MNEDKIEVGEYIRTKKGYIGKILIIYGKDAFYRNMNCYSVDTIDGAVYEEDIKVHSKNIIDLIEVSDYVNGYKIYVIDNLEDLEREYRKCFTIYKGINKDLIKVWSNKDIKTIVTKEQFKAMEYRV